MDLFSYLLGKNSSGGGDVSEYFLDTISKGYNTSSSILKIIKKIPSPITVNGTELTYAFYNCTNLLEIPTIDTKDVTTMSHCFDGCQSITNIPTLDTRNVTDMSSMFNNCTSLTNIVINYNLSKVTKYDSMFNVCSNLESVEFNNTIDNTLSISAKTLFNNCTKLTHIDLRYLDLTKLTNYTNMFGALASNGVPNNSEIIVADQTQKNWVNTNFSRLTNVKTVAEYES